MKGLVELRQIEFEEESWQKFKESFLNQAELNGFYHKTPISKCSLLIVRKSNKARRQLYEIFAF